MLLDLQADFLGPEARMPVAADQVAGVIAANNALIDRAAARGLEVVYIGNEFRPDDWIANWVRHGAAVRGTPGTRLDSRVHRVGTAYFAKDQGDAFSNPALADYLRDHEVGQVVLTGLYADGCVSDTAQGAWQRGYQVTVVTDAVAAASEANRQAACDRLSRQGAVLMTSAAWLSR